jgi:tRNA G10  N-methylase Trm11
MTKRKLDKTRYVKTDDLILTSTVGDNAVAFVDILALYAQEGQVIADVTYGKGRFWRKVDITKYNFFPSDVKTGIDFRNLPYEENFCNIVVLDPPYRPNHRGRAIEGYDDAYQLDNSGLYLNADVLKLYEEGMKEAYRVIKPKGFLFLKCQDVIECSKQHWNHIELYKKALEMGFIAEDLFVVISKNKPSAVMYKQVHARKNHSFFWIFKKK